jgi:hypothetical protein
MRAGGLAASRKVALDACRLMAADLQCGPIATSQQSGLDVLQMHSPPGSLTLRLAPNFGMVLLRYALVRQSIQTE